LNILIVTEKPGVTRAIVPLVRKRWPMESIVFVHAMPFVNIRFSYPRGLKLHEFPVLSEPRDRLVSWEEWACAPLVLAADGSLAQVPMSPELFTAADHIVCACDADPTGAVAFSVLMQRVFGDGRAIACPTLTLRSLDDASIEAAFGNLGEFGSVAGVNLAYGSIKRYFDWNWNVNSLAVLGETQRRAGVPDGAPAMSKYALQLLYGMRYERPRTDGTVVSVMHHWQGTGRYKGQTGRWRPRLGSASSMAQMLENLLAAGLLDRIPVGGQNGLVVSERGHTLLRLLHPDCEDPDLPFRLHAWCEEGASAKPAVDRYIRTVFGKQLRFLRRVAAN
jgi:hypothetical protein